MRYRLLLYSCVLLSPLCAACSGLPARGVSAHNGLNDQTRARKVVTIEGTIDEGEPVPWKIMSTKTGGRQNLDHIYFLDEFRGWVGGREALYRTFDGGQNWEKVEVQMPDRASVTAIFFTNPSVGWVALQRRAPDILSYQENQFWLLQTADGGQTWQLQHEEREALITNISFIDEREGWLTGSRYIGLAPFRFVHLVFHTTDQGQHWQDVSKELNYVAQNDHGIVNDVISDIKLNNPSALIALTGAGRVFKTEDEGRSWEQLEAIDDAWGWPWYKRIGFNESGFLWVAGGADSSRGQWGMILEEHTGYWTKYKLDGVYFTDAVSLPDNQIIACGSVVSDKGVGTDDGRREGVVLYSPDGGQKWCIIYRNAQIENVNALAAVNSNHIWAAGDKGLILILSVPGKNI